MAFTQIIENMADEDYAITSARVEATLHLSMISAAAVFEITAVSDPATQIVLSRPGWSKLLDLPAPTQQEELFTLPGESRQRRLRWQTGDVDAGRITVTIHLEDADDLAFDEPWDISVTGLPAGSVTDLVAGDFAVITAIEADPIIEVQPPSQDRYENEVADLRAVVRRNTHPAPTTDCGGLSLVWSQVEEDVTSAPTSATATTPTISGGLPACIADATVALPGVHEETLLNYKIVAQVGAFSNQEEATVRVLSRVRNSILVLDRSGSMSADDRWPHAVRAAHLWLDLLVAMRGEFADDKVGVMVFEDQQCRFRVPVPGDDDSKPDVDNIDVVFPSAGSLAELSGASTPTLDLGSPGTCTPIGDAVITALKRLAEATPTDDLGNLRPDLYSVLFLTDGYENSGTVKVDRDTPGTAGQILDAAIASEPLITDRLRLSGLTRNTFFYTVGVGPHGGVQEDVLESLANTTTATDGGHYTLVDKASQLKQVFWDMAEDFLGGIQQDASHTPTRVDPESPTPGEAAYLLVPAQEHKLVVAVVHDAGDEIELKLRPQEGPNDFTSPPPSSMTRFKRAEHTVIAISLPYAFQVDSAPASEWRVQRFSGDPNHPSTVIKPIDLESVVSARDLHVRSEVSFDQDVYYSGDTMRLSVRVTAGGRPVKKVFARVVLDRPAFSLGTFLAKNSHKFDPPRPRGDKLHPKAQLLQHALKLNGLEELPNYQPSNIFADGTNRLHREEPGGEFRGVFSNLLKDTPVEGTYTFRILIEGYIPGEGQFRDTLRVSKWFGIRPNPFKSPVTFDWEVPAPNGLQGVAITVEPVDTKGEYLGPFQSANVQFRARRGVWQGPVQADLQGRYTRVLYFQPKQPPTVAISVNGVDFPEFTLGSMIRHILRCRSFQRKEQ